MSLEVAEGHERQAAHARTAQAAALPLACKHDALQLDAAVRAAAALQDDEAVARDVDAGRRHRKTRRFLALGAVARKRLQEKRMITSKLTSKAQTTVPQPVRAALGLKAGDLLWYELAGGAGDSAQVPLDPGPRRPLRCIRRVAHTG